MPPYHTFIGNNLTIYLDIVGDTDATLGIPIDNAVAQLAAVWGAIATANQWVVTFAFGPATAIPTAPVPTGVNFTSVAVAPAGVNFFRFTIGCGASAIPNTRSGCISYAMHGQGTGYIYQLPQAAPALAPDLSHEIGHVLGLSDRYYDAVFWRIDQALQMTCQQIRQGTWIIANVDMRAGVPDNLQSPSQGPRLAVRTTLPLIVAGEAVRNLMSTNAPTLTPTQIAVIISRGVERNYRTANWIAILGEWRTYPANQLTNLGFPSIRPAGALGQPPAFPAEHLNMPNRWRYTTWEATPQDGGTGLLFLPPGFSTPGRYPCLAKNNTSRDLSGNVIDPGRLARARGRTRIFAFAGTTYNEIGRNVVYPNWMCHVRTLIQDLLSA